MVKIPCHAILSDQGPTTNKVSRTRGGSPTKHLPAGTRHAVIVVRQRTTLPCRPSALARLGDGPVLLDPDGSSSASGTRQIQSCERRRSLPTRPATQAIHSVLSCWIQLAHVISKMWRKFTVNMRAFAVHVCRIVGVPSEAGATDPLRRYLPTEVIGGWQEPRGPTRQVRPVRNSAGSSAT